MLKKYIYSGFSFDGLEIIQKNNCTKVYRIHEILLLIEKNYNISILDIKKGIYWVVCLISTFFIVEGKKYRKIFQCFFYNFLPTFVLVKRKGYLSFASMKGMGGGELLWRKLLPVGMKQIKNCSTVIVKGF